MDDVFITADDQHRIDGLVSAYRHSLENLYRVAYLQGMIAQAEEENSRLKAAIRNVA